MECTSEKQKLFLELMNLRGLRVKTQLNVFFFNYSLIMYS
jgi:hypothetical protein